MWCKNSGVFIIEGKIKKFWDYGPISFVDKNLGNEMYNSRALLLRQIIVVDFQFMSFLSNLKEMFQDKAGIKMPKWTVFEISFHWKHQCFCFHCWDYLTDIWHNNWQSIFDGVLRRTQLNRYIQVKLICSYIS